MTKEIEVLVVEPGMTPRVARTENTLEAFGEIIGGPVETGCILPQRVMLFYNNQKETIITRQTQEAMGEAFLVGHGTRLVVHPGSTAYA